MAQIRALLVDDSILFLSSMREAVSASPNITVVGVAQDGVKALELALSLRPDVIVCDVQMPKMSGIDFLQNLLPKYQVPVVVISSTPDVTLQALQSGAIEFIRKPGGTVTAESFFQRLVSTIEMAASANIKAKISEISPVHHSHRPGSNLLKTIHKDVVVAIGASTGGTEAIAAIAKELPANFPGVVVTQHMPAGFTAMYASRLARECRMKVTEAVDGQRLGTGQMIIAAGEHHLRLHKDALGYYVSSRREEKVSGHAPSVDVLFDSVANAAGPKAVGVILTGMGGDGAEGLLKMRRAGAYTIGQDKQSCVVYGMPMVAYEKGAVVKQLSLNKIADELVRYLNSARI